MVFPFHFGITKLIMFFNELTRRSIWKEFFLQNREWKFCEFLGICRFGKLPYRFAELYSFRRKFSQWPLLIKFAQWASITKGETGSGQEFLCHCPAGEGSVSRSPKTTLRSALPRSPGSRGFSRNFPWIEKVSSSTSDSTAARPSQTLRF